MRLELATPTNQGGEVHFPHPILQEGRFSGLSRRVKPPTELVPNIPVKLRPNEAVFRGKHIVVCRVAGCGGVKEAYEVFRGGWS